MTKPDKPLEAQGLGCGLMISIVGIAALLAWIGLPPVVAIWTSLIIAGLSLITYAGNQFKSQRILDNEYEGLKPHQSVARKPSKMHEGSDGDGMYCVVGVDKETGMDTSWHTRALSAANAKVKAELEGIIVTEVTKV